MQKPVTDSVGALQAQLEARGVKFLMPTYVDMHGISKTKIVPIAHMGQMVDGSELCTGAALDGVPQDVSDEEVSAHPDIKSATILPWDQEVAWFASDLWCGGKPFEPCSRNILKRTLAMDWVSPDRYRGKANDRPGSVAGAIAQRSRSDG